MNETRVTMVSFVCRLSAHFFVFLLMTSSVYATHPLVTEDAGTQGAGRFQLKVNGELGVDEEGGLKKRTGKASAAVNYGIADNVDLLLGMPYLYYRIQKNGLVLTEEDGPGDLALGIKWRFFEYEERGLGIAFMPGLTLPTGDEKNGLGNGRVSGGGRLIVSKEGVLGALHLNLGYTRNEYDSEDARLFFRNDIWSASFAAMINLTVDIRGVWDIGMETSAEKGTDQHPAFMTGGLIYTVTDDFDVDTGVKWGLNGPETDTTWLAGMVLRF